MKRLATLVALFSIVPFAFADETENEHLDYGDYSSVTLQVKSWEALGRGAYDAVLKYTGKCAEMYEEKAREMQASLDKKPSGDDINKYWALNDVGTCYFIRGEALTKLERNAEALEAYKVVRDDLHYSQAWDPKGWHWSPAEAAYPKIKKLENQDKIDF